MKVRIIIAFESDEFPDSFTDEMLWIKANDLRDRHFVMDNFPSVFPLRIWRQRSDEAKMEMATPEIDQIKYWSMFK